ncbi:hypothetical protein [Amycolatopsis sp. NPDC004169]|uniref:hypothetical protein n=1 Tax=Amycolatopsis sp. NPDC004169 TaxID=3154453 RepID=UPI0033B3C9EA
MTIGPRAQPFRLAAGEKATVPVAGRVRTGGCSSRVAAHGRLAYSPAVEVRIE